MADLPRSVRTFLWTYISSVEQLDVLLLLARGGGSWTADEVHEELKTTRASVERRMLELEHHRLVRREASTDPPSFRYADEDQLREAIVLHLAALDATWRPRIVTEIFSAPKHALRDFSDAFRIRRTDEE
jgi:hypothetical protein